MSRLLSWRPHAPFAIPGLAQVSAAGILWGTGGLAAQLVRRHADLSPLTISAYRTAIAAVVLFAAVLASRRVGAVRHLLADRPIRAAGLGILTGAYQALYFVSVVAVGVTVSTVVSLGVAPVILTGAAALRTRTLPSMRSVTVVIAAITGLVLVAGTSGAGITGPHPALGVCAALGSGTAYAAATAIAAPMARSTDPLALTAVTVTAGSFVLVPAALVMTAVDGSVAFTTDPTALVALLYVGAITMAVAYALFYAGLRTTTSANAVIATLLEPVTAAIVAAIVLGEALRPTGILGSLLILLALAAAGRSSRPTPPDSQAAVPPP